jgi:uncharacterized protein YqfA (UPF0365 family)
MIKLIPKIIPHVSCTPIGCITLFVVIVSLVLTYAFSPVNKRLDRLENKVDKIYEYLIGMPQKTVTPGSSLVLGHDKTKS